MADAGNEGELDTSGRSGGFTPKGREVEILRGKDGEKIVVEIKRGPGGGISRAGRVEKETDSGRK